MPALLTSCLPHFTAFFSVCSHNLNKKIFLALLIGHIFHTQHKHNDKNDPLSFWTKVAFSKLLHCQRTHQPITMVARSRRHFHGSSISNNADKLIISVPEQQRLSDTWLKQRRQYVVRWGRQLGYEALTCKSANNCPADILKYIQNRRWYTVPLYLYFIGGGVPLAVPLFFLGKHDEEKIFCAVKTFS